MSTDNGTTPTPDPADEVEAEVIETPRVIPAMHVSAGRMTFNISIAEADDGKKFVLFHVEHSTGSTVLPMEAAFARRIAGMLEEAAAKASGLIVARVELPPNWDPAG